MLSGFGIWPQLPESRASGDDVADCYWDDAAISQCVGLGKERPPGLGTASATSSTAAPNLIRSVQRKL